MVCRAGTAGHLGKLPFWSARNILEPGGGVGHTVSRGMSRGSTSRDRERGAAEWMPFHQHCPPGSRCRPGLGCRALSQGTRPYYAHSALLCALGTGIMAASRVLKAECDYNNNKAHRHAGVQGLRGLGTATRTAENGGQQPSHALEART